MPTRHGFTVGATPITVLQSRGCAVARAAGKLVAALRAAAVLPGCGAAPCLAAIRTIKRHLSLGAVAP